MAGGHGRAGPGAVPTWSVPSGAKPLPTAPPAAGSTISVPWIMFIAHANPNCPASAGSNRTAVCW